MNFILHTLLLLTAFVSITQGQTLFTDRQKTVNYNLHLCSLGNKDLNTAKSKIEYEFSQKLKEKEALVESKKHLSAELDRHLESLTKAGDERCKQAFSLREEYQTTLDEFINGSRLASGVEVVEDMNHILAIELNTLQLDLFRFAYASQYWLVSLKAIFAEADRDETVEIDELITDLVSDHLKASIELEVNVEAAFKAIMTKCTQEHIQDKSEIQTEWNQLTESIKLFVDTRYQVMQSLYDTYISIDDTIPVLSDLSADTLVVEDQASDEQELTDDAQDDGADNDVNAVLDANSELGELIDQETALQEKDSIKEDDTQQPSATVSPAPSMTTSTPQTNNQKLVAPAPSASTAPSNTGLFGRFF